MIFRFGVVLSFLATVSALTLSTCTPSGLRDAFLEAADNTVFVTCAGTVKVDTAFNVPTGFVFNGTGKLTIVATGDFPIFNIQGHAYIGGVTLKNGKGTDGGCIATAAGTAMMNITLTDVRFENCHASGAGGGLFIQPHVVAELTRLTFWNCSAGRGGALAAPGGAVSVHCTDCDFQNNSANSAGGGAVYVQDTTVTFSQTNFYNNQAKANNASGGAVYSQSCIFMCEECYFVSNIAASGRAGGVYAIGATPSGSDAGTEGIITLQDTFFLNNEGVDRGSAVYVCVQDTEQLYVLNGAICDNVLNQPDDSRVGTGIHVDCPGSVGVDSVTFAGNLPEGDQFNSANGAQLLFFQLTDVGTETARETCDIQQNFTKSQESSPPTPSFLSEATAHTISIALFFVVPLVW